MWCLLPPLTPGSFVSPGPSLPAVVRERVEDEPLLPQLPLPEPGCRQPQVKASGRSIAGRDF